MHKTHALIPAALGAIALVPAAASAHGRAPVAHAAGIGNKIVLYKSIGGASLGMTPAKVRRRIGKPSHINRLSGKIDEFVYQKGFNEILTVDFDTSQKGDPANGVFGFRSSMHTATGIHPGSTVKALKHAYGKSLHKFPGGYALYQSADKTLTTQFATSHGKVDLIDVQD